MHENCKCVCRLDPTICNKKQRWNKDKCRCECLKNNKCANKFYNPNSCKCEYRKKAALIGEECEIIEKKNVSVKKYNKTVSIIIENTSKDTCKPFVASSFFFY